MVDFTTNVTLPIYGEGGPTPSSDFVMLTLDNGSVSMFTNYGASPMCVFVKSGFYISNAYAAAFGWQGSASPQLFCEVHQR